MFDLALHHLSDTDRERQAEADLRRRQVLKSPDVAVARETRSAARPTPSRLSVDPRPAER